MNRFTMDYDDSPCEAEYLSLLPERGVYWDVFGSGLDTHDAEALIRQYDTQAINQLQDYIKQASQTMQPWVTEGETAGGSLGSYLGLSGYPQINPSQQLSQTPGYQFNLGEGLNALQSYGASRGLATSGAGRTGAQTYGAGLASNTYQQYLKNLMGVYNTGAGAAGTTAGAYMTGGGDIASILQSEGANLAGASLAGQMGGSRGGGMLGSILGTIGGIGLGSFLGPIGTAIGSGLGSIFGGLGSGMNPIAMAAASPATGASI